MERRVQEGESQGEIEIDIKKLAGTDISSLSFKIAAFSLEEKVSIATGVGWMGGRCVVSPRRDRISSAVDIM